MTGWHHYPPYYMGGLWRVAAELFDQGRPVRTENGLTIRTAAHKDKTRAEVELDALLD